MAADPGGLTLRGDEADAVADTCEAFAAALPPARAERFLQVAAQARAGVIAPDRLEDLQRVCAAALETGRARRAGTAESERLLAAVYRRTPAGSEQAAQLAEVNAALARLAGRSLRSVSVAAPVPGRYRLHLALDGADLTVDLEPQAVTVSRLEAG
ncbi:MAG: hypothetical protein EPN43_13365 [Jatrophihabitans sp.]|nr:MAG: hypothetical protein EPN43_13365 [Jatrophihabitans sp.]